MSELKRYNSPGAFKSAFQHHYREAPRALVIVMERFAARVCREIDGAVIKGGLGLELRLETPRTTKDADMIVSGSADLEPRLRRAGELDLGDYMKFAIKRARGGDFVVPGMAYPGKRYDVQAFFDSGPPPWASKAFRKFAVEIDIRDSASHDVLYSSMDRFPQVERAPIRVYGLHEQLAEKVHAYTDPRHRNAIDERMMRPRDLLDLCRCAISDRVSLDGERLREALQAIFARRKAAAKDVVLHDLPTFLPDMPEPWRESFVRESEQAGLPWRDPAVAHELASRFLNPCFDGTAIGTWDPTARRWVDDE